MTRFVRNELVSRQSPTSITASKGLILSVVRLPTNMESLAAAVDRLIGCQSSVPVLLMRSPAYPRTKSFYHDASITEDERTTIIDLLELSGRHLDHAFRVPEAPLEPFSKVIDGLYFQL